VDPDGQQLLLGAFKATPGQEEHGQQRVEHLDQELQEREREHARAASRHPPPKRPQCLLERHRRGLDVAALERQLPQPGLGLSVLEAASGPATSLLQGLLGLVVAAPQHQHRPQTARDLMPHGGLGGEGTALGDPVLAL
jgi:hypothetical protein